MKHTFPFLFPIKGGIKNDPADRKIPEVMSFCPDKVTTADDIRTGPVNNNGACISIEAALLGLLILELIHRPRTQERNLTASSDKLLEKNPHLKNNRYYKAAKRRQLMNNSKLTLSKVSLIF